MRLVCALKGASGEVIPLPVGNAGWVKRWTQKRGPVWGWRKATGRRQECDEACRSVDAGKPRAECGSCERNEVWVGQPRTE